MSRSENLPVLPESLSAILELTDSTDVSARSIEKMLERDAAVSTKVLKVANSPYYATGKVHSISRAVQVIGVAGLKSVVTSLAMQALINGHSATKRFSRMDYWKHSLATAVCCRIIGRLKMPMDAEELYAAGLLHDVGLIIMDRFIPMELDRCLEESSVSGMPLHYVEKDRLGYTHAEVGALLAEKWSFSPMTVAALRYHHEPDMDTVFNRTTSVVCLANAFAHEAGFCNSQVPGVCTRDPYLLRSLDISDDNAEVIEQVTAHEIERASEAFQIAA